MRKTITKGIVFGLTSIITMLISGMLLVYSATQLNNVEKGETLTAVTLNGIIDWINNEGASKNYVDNHSIDKVCPDGFTKLQTTAIYDNNIRTLGCIQNNVEGTTNWKSAVVNCWENYGGRLPTYNEVNIAANISDIYNTHGREWLDGGYAGRSMNVLQFSDDSNPRTSGADSPGTNNTYRCFIPFN